MKEVKRYQCDYCNKVFANKSHVINKHEPNCFKNVESKSCLTCLNFIPFSPYSVYEDRHCNAEINIKKKLKTRCDKYVLDELHRERLF